MCTRLNCNVIRIPIDLAKKTYQYAADGRTVRMRYSIEANDAWLETVEATVRLKAYAYSRRWIVDPMGEMKAFWTTLHDGCTNDPSHVEYGQSVLMDEFEQDEQRGRQNESTSRTI